MIGNRPFRFLMPVPFCAAGLVLFESARARGADGDEADRCIAAAEEGQQLRDANRFKSAREMFVSCTDTTCPAMIREDCTNWLKALDDHVPTVVVDARDGDGNALTDVAVSIDREPWAAKLGSKPEFVADPGEHLFRFEAAGFAPVEEQVTIRPGERGRVIAVRLERVTPPPAPAPTKQEESPGARRPSVTATPARGRTPPLASWILAGVSVASFGAEAYFGVSGMSRHNSDLQTGGCAPHCSASERSSIHGMFLVADVSLGVGLASAGLAAYLFFASERKSEVAPSVTIAPQPGGAAAALTGRF